MVNDISFLASGRVSVCLSLHYELVTDKAFLFRPFACLEALSSCGLCTSQEYEYSYPFDMLKCWAWWTFETDGRGAWIQTFLYCYYRSVCLCLM